MTCAQLHDVAAELALGVLTGRERATAIAHLDRCRACREEVRQLMAVGGLLPELLSPAEPPAGFETRVLQLLRASAQPEGQSQPLPLPRPLPRPDRVERPDVERPGVEWPGVEWLGAERPGGKRLGVERRGGKRLGVERRASMAGGGPGESGGPGRVRRAFAATAMGLAVIAAALGGWRIVGGPSPAASSATARLTSASLLSATRSSSVGSVFLYSGTPRWLYMSVDLGSGDEFVTCQVVGADGRASTVGSFQLADGYGTWGSPDPGNVGAVTGARLLSADGVVLATATFPR